MKVCILGLGYIGLPTAALMAKAGHDVKFKGLVGRKPSARILNFCDLEVL